MSVRAYKIITKELSNAPSFNLWHDEDLLQIFKDSGMYEEERFIEIPVPAIKKALEIYKWEDKDYRRAQLEEDILGLSDDDVVEYECY